MSLVNATAICPETTTSAVASSTPPSPISAAKKPFFISRARLEDIEALKRILYTYAIDEDSLREALETAVADNLPVSVSLLLDFIPAAANDALFKTISSHAHFYKDYRVLEAVLSHKSSRTLSAYAKESALLALSNNGEAEKPIGMLLALPGDDYGCTISKEKRAQALQRAARSFDVGATSAILANSPDLDLTDKVAAMQNASPQNVLKILDTLDATIRIKWQSAIQNESLLDSISRIAGDLFSYGSKKPWSSFDTYMSESLRNELTDILDTLAEEQMFMRLHVNTILSANGKKIAELLENPDLSQRTIGQLFLISVSLNREEAIVQFLQDKVVTRIHPNVMQEAIHQAASEERFLLLETLARNPFIQPDAELSGLIAKYKK